MAHYAIPGVALALIADSEIAAEAGYGVKEAGGDDPVTPATRFQACSISKPVAVLGMLRLVEQGVLDLDADVNEMLMSWRVPPNASWQPRVTLRQIASHSAGLTVGGFPGYARGAALPTLREILTGSAPANTPGIRVDTLPGRRVPLRRRRHDRAATGARGRHRPPVREADARARPRSSRDVPQRLHAAAAGRAARRRVNGAQGGRKSGGRRLARVPGARRRGPVDDAGRPCALRRRGAARSRRRTLGDPRAGAHGVDADPLIPGLPRGSVASTPSASACSSAARGSGTAAATRASGATWSRIATRDAASR